MSLNDSQRQSTTCDPSPSGERVPKRQRGVPGVPTIPHYTDAQLAEVLPRIMARTRLGPGCWQWTGPDNGTGYARIGVGGGYAMAHRLVFMANHGPIPPGMVVRHTCDNRRCVNPDHLVLGTQDDNVRDMVERGRCPRGADHWAAKLTPDTVLEIRARVAAGERQRDVAAAFGVAYITVQRIAQRRTWRHLP